MSEIEHLSIKKSNWRGLTLQLFLITVLPLTAFLLLVAFGSQTLHREAMRNLVGDRDLRTVRAISSAMDQEISHLSDTIQIISRSLNGKSDLSSIILKPDEISSIFDGGMALYDTDGNLIQSSSSIISWQSIPKQIPDYFITLLNGNSHPSFSTLISSEGTTSSYVFVGILTEYQQLLIGAFTPDQLVKNAISNLVNSVQFNVLVVGPGYLKGEVDLLYRGGSETMNEIGISHPGVKEALDGESGINYYQSNKGEHVVAFNSIPSIGWGLVIEETWEDIASQYLVTTQSAPLIIVPVFLLAVITLLFGVHRIVRPLQKLEKQAASLAAGNFEEINRPVGGIEEIRNLQSELVEMAEKLKAAQQNLHSYIGSITAGIENERRNLARELHDDTIQALIAFNQRIQMILIKSSDSQKKALIELQSLIQQSMTDLRRIIRGLRPIYLEDLGLLASLEMLAREIEQTVDIPINFVSNGQEHRFDAKSEMFLYRMVQESLNNVIHHADAKHAWVEVNFSDSDLSIQIRDDGKGFMVPTNPAEFPKRGHFGLLGLKERAELIHSNLEIISSIGKGTLVLITLDYD